MWRGRAVVFMVCIGVVGIVTWAYGQVDTAWVRQYNGTGNGSDIADALKVDAAGNIYVSGRSWSGKSLDNVILKYDPAGRLQWERRYTSSVNEGNRAMALELDAAGNVYVTGTQGHDSIHQGYYTLKYDPSGHLLWEKWHNWPVDGPKFIYDVHTDANGAVYVAGVRDTPDERSRSTTMKFDSSGHLLWERPYGGRQIPFDIIHALEVDIAGNVYVTGQSWSRAGTDFLTLKYDPAGNLLWQCGYEGPGNSSDVATAIGVDASGSVYITGYSRGTGSEYDYVTVKYDLTGHTLWERRSGGPARSPSRACALQVDGRGDVYVTGCGRGRGPDFDYVTLRYGPTGDLLWDRRYDGPGHSRDGAMAVEVDTVGNVYVTGASWIDGADYDFVTVKYLPDVVRRR